MTKSIISSNTTLNWKHCFQNCQESHMYQKVSILRWCMLSIPLRGNMKSNATFNNISWRSVLLVEETQVPEKTTNLPQVNDKRYHI
jgi:hypothetical protein